MITIQNRLMIIPEEERVIGHLGDNLAKTREFFIAQDCAESWIFRLYLKFKSGRENFFTLEAAQTPAGTKLRWKIKREHIFENGIVQVQVKVFDDTGEIWHTTTGYFEVMESLEFSQEAFLPTEFEELEKKVNEKLLEIKNAQMLPPIVGENGNWQIFHTNTQSYEDSGQSAKGEKGDMGTLSDGSVETAHIKDSAVTTEKIANNAITRDQLAMNAVSHLNINDQCITARNIVDKSITAQQLADDTVTYIKMGNSSVGSRNIINGSINAQKLTQDCVQTDHLTDASVTPEKLSQSSKAYIADTIQQSKYAIALDDSHELALTNEKSGTTYRACAYDDGSIAVLNADNNAVFSFDTKGMKELKTVNKSILYGQASGQDVQITDGVANTDVKSLVVKGRSVLGDTQQEGAKPLSPVYLEAVSLTGTAAGSTVHYTLAKRLPLYSTPGNTYFDCYDAVSGQITKQCEVYLLSTLNFHTYSAASETVTCISTTRFIPYTQAYRVTNGAVSSFSINWQGQIELRFNKADVGITAEDTASQALAKLRTYLGDSYAVAALKTPEISRGEKFEIVLPAQQTTVNTGNCESEITYQRDINSAYLDLLARTRDLEARIAQLEIG